MRVVWAREDCDGDGEFVWMGEISGGEGEFVWMGRRGGTIGWCDGERDVVVFGRSREIKTLEKK